MGGVPLSSKPILPAFPTQVRSGVITGPGSRIVEFAWNPVLASMLAVVFSNGSAALYMVDAANGSKGCLSTCAD